MLRKSERSKVVVSSIFPVRNPFPSGLNRSMTSVFSRLSEASATSLLRLPNLRFSIVLSLRPQQRLDRAALVHRAVALRHLVERQGQIENLAGGDLPVPHQVDQPG